MKRMSVLLVMALLFCFAAVSNAAQVGDKGRAMWQGKEYDVKVLKISKDGAKCFITWPGYSSSWDEWRDCSSIRISGSAKAEKPSSPKYSIGDQVKVKWKNSWYDASIMSFNEKKNTYMIHYDGYDKSWDEWVTLNRIRPK